MKYWRSIGVGLVTVLACFALTQVAARLLQAMLPKTTPPGNGGDVGVSWAITFKPIQYLLFLIGVFALVVPLEYLRLRNKDRTNH